MSRNQLYLPEGLFVNDDDSLGGVVIGKNGTVFIFNWATDQHKDDLNITITGRRL